MKHATRIISLLLIGFTGTTAAPALAGNGARQLIEDTAAEMFAAMKQERQALQANPRHIHALIDRILLPHIDLQRMSRWVLGKHWRRASASQREHFTQEFRRLLMRTYATALLEYADQTIRYLPARTDEAADNVIVRTVIDDRGGLSIPINYSMSFSQGAWKAYDITIDGISLIGNYRNTFARQVHSGGLDRLISTLASHNRQALQRVSNLAQ